MQKPPIGIIPKNVWVDKINRERFVEICETMKRYLNHSIEYKIPDCILEEYKHLSQYIKFDYSLVEQGEKNANTNFQHNI